jgi:hypothetical protein
MGFFSFIETFFFISLIITFVLLVMLIYHFKQRIMKLEDKTNTLVEIVNDIVKEIKSVNSLGNITNNMPFVVQPMGSQVPLDNRYEGIPENIKTILIENHETDSDSDEEEEDDDESESDEQSESVSDESDSDEESVVETTNLHEISVPQLEILETFEPPSIVENTFESEPIESNIKTISIDLGNEVDMVLENVVHEDEAEDATIELDVDAMIESESIVEPSEESNNVATTEVLSNKRAVYENMAPSALKNLIVQRGLTSADVSKMKKNKLVQILVDSDE